VKTTYETALAFRENFKRALKKRLPNSTADFSTINDKQLCFLYEELPHKNKRGIWPEVARAINKDDKWAAKHYLNSFKRAMYPGELTKEHKNRITQMVKEKWIPDGEKKSLVDEAKEMLKEYQIFPDAIQSFVFQAIVRFENELNRINANRYKNKNENRPTPKIVNHNSEIFPIIPTIQTDISGNNHSDNTSEVPDSWSSPSCM